MAVLGLAAAAASRWSLADATPAEHHLDLVAGYGA